MYHIGCGRSCYDSDAPDSNATRSVILTFHRDQLLYDIKNYAYIEGHVWGEENQHAQHTLVEIGEEICDRMWVPVDYKIQMRVPATMSRTTLHLLNKLIHEFMVARVIYDWLSITHPEAARNWLDKASEAQEEINSIKNSRTGVLRRPSHPF